MKKKVFIATSSFLELEYFKKNSKFKEFKFILNPLKKKLSSKELLLYAKNCEYIIAGTENTQKYNK